MMVEDSRTLKIINESGNTAPEGEEGRKRKRKRTPHSKKANKVGDGLETHQESDPPPFHKIDSVTNDASPPKEEKRAKKSQKPQESRDVEDPKPKRHQKQKRTIESGVPEELNSAIITTEDLPNKKMRKHKEDVQTTIPPDISDMPTNDIPIKSEKSSKRKRTSLDAPEVGLTAGEADETEKPKRKRKKKTDTTEAWIESTEPPAPKIKKKGPKVDGDFPNPSGDSSLSESALRALEYVHFYLTFTQDWKFNKARQNWIIRNLWDDAIVPDLYFPSCVKYLHGVQGNTRDVLIKSSNDIIEKNSIQAAAAAKKAALSVKVTKVRFQDSRGAKSEAVKEDSGSGNMVEKAIEADVGVEKASEELISPNKAERARNVLKGLGVGTT